MEQLVYFAVSTFAPLIAVAAGTTTGALCLLWLAVSFYKFFQQNISNNI